jgi:hypothetical protein
MIDIFQHKMIIIQSLVQEIMNSKDASNELKDELVIIIDVINKIQEEMTIKIQPVTEQAKIDLQNKLIMKSVELDIRINELMFLIFLFSNKGILKTLIN